VTNSQPGLRVWRAGLVPYRQALAWQERLVAERPAWSHDLLLLLEHPPVITLGRGANRAHIRCTEQELAERGIDMVETSRGGDVTFHGPGQLVGYPLIDLNRSGRDLHLFLRRLEDVLIRTVADFGLNPGQAAGRTGVWIGKKKIASIGVAVRQWITWHGFALNVATRHEGFAAIVPCGLHGVEMTSLQGELGREVPVQEITGQLVQHFSAVFDRPLLGIDDIAPAA
jgi:lipoate-protein ligase B